MSLEIIFKLLIILFCNLWLCWCNSACSLIKTSIYYIIQHFIHYAANMVAWETGKCFWWVPFRVVCSQLGLSGLPELMKEPLVHIFSADMVSTVNAIDTDTSQPRTCAAHVSFLEFSHFIANKISFFFKVSYTHSDILQDRCDKTITTVLNVHWQKSNKNVTNVIIYSLMLWISLSFICDLFCLHIKSCYPCRPILYRPVGYVIQFLPNAFF